MTPPPSPQPPFRPGRAAAAWPGGDRTVLRHCSWRGFQRPALDGSTVMKLGDLSLARGGPSEPAPMARRGRVVLVRQPGVGCRWKGVRAGWQAAVARPGECDLVAEPGQGPLVVADEVVAVAGVAAHYRPGDADRGVGGSSSRGASKPCHRPGYTPAIWPGSLTPSSGHSSATCSTSSVPGRRRSSRRGRPATSPRTWSYASATTSPARGLSCPAGGAAWLNDEEERSR